MKRLSIIIVFLCWWAIAFSQETYLPAFELPDLIKCLPAPPEKGTPAFKYDVQRYRWGKAQRSNPERAHHAQLDGGTSPSRTSPSRILTSHSRYSDRFLYLGSPKASGSKPIFRASYRFL